MARPSTLAPPVALPADYWQARGSYLAALHEARGPVVPALLGQTPVVFLLGPDANRAVLQTHRAHFAHRAAWDWYFGRPTEPPNLLTMDDPAHAWHRRLLHPAVAAPRLDETRPLVAAVVERRLAAWAARDSVDIYEEARVVALDAVAAVLLGLQRPAHLALCRAVYLYGTHQRAADFSRLLQALLEERRARPTTDVLGLLAGARDGDGAPLTAEQIRAQVDVLLIAGHETSASLAAWTFHLLATHPSWQDRVRAETAASPHAAHGRFSAVERVVREAERLYPPVPVAPRVVRSAVEVCGHGLPAGARVFYSAAATHLLPGLWTDPATFDPDRFAPPREEHRRHPYALVGFGGGPRICIGRTLARLTLTTFVAAALRRYILAPLSGSRAVQRPGVTSRPAGGLRLRLTRHEAYR